MRALISGSSIAGPVAAYWLTRNGFDVTVVERASQLRKMGGHAVDLFRPAMDIADRMGVSAEVESRETGTDRLTVYRQGNCRLDWCAECQEWAAAACGFTTLTFCPSTVARFPATDSTDQGNPAELAPGRQLRHLYQRVRREVWSADRSLPGVGDFVDRWSRLWHLFSRSVLSCW